MNRYLLPFGLLLCLHVNVWSQNIAEAEQLSKQGKYEAAELVYRQLLAQHPADTRTLLLSAANLSWNRQFVPARERYNEVLKLKPNDEEALAGIAYTYAWNDEHEKAAHYFNTILKMNAASKEAQKGMGYVYLGSGKLKKAEPIFATLARQYPTDNEFKMALAQVYIRRAHYSKAKQQLDEVQRSNPQYPSLAEYREQVEQAPAFAEFDTWGGFSSAAGEQQTGLRNISLSVKTAARTKAIARFDNNLSLDNRFFAQQQLNANAFFAGAIHDWNSRLTTRAELGYRNIPGKGAQQLVAAEQVFFFAAGEEQRLYNLKLGGFVATGNNAGNEYMLYSGVSIPVSPVFYAEPAYYFSTMASGSLRQHRIQGGVKYLNRKRLEITGGGFWAKEFAPFINGGGTLYGGYFMAVYPIKRKLAALAFARNEWGITENLFSAGLGIKLKLYR